MTFWDFCDKHFGGLVFLAIGGMLLVGWCFTWWRVTRALGNDEME